MKLTNKHKELLRVAVKPSTNAITLEGPAQTGKSNIAILAFMLRVAKSKGKLHCIAASDLDAIRDNILKGEFKLLDLFGDLVELVSEKIGGYFLRYHTPNGVKDIILAGYKDKAKWKKILGKPIECWFIDEVNIADKNFFDEHKARTFSFEHPFTITTLNGDDPEHYIYTDYINTSIDLFPQDTPQSTLNDMNEYDKVKGKYYAFWGLDDHPTMTPEKKQRIMSAFPKDSFYYMTKVLGIRGIQEGLLYGHLIKSSHYVDWEQVNINAIRELEVGIDLGDNAKTVFTLTGYTERHQRALVIAVEESDEVRHDKIIQDLHEWLREWYHIFGTRIKCVWPDSAESMFVKTLKQDIIFPISVKSSKKMTIAERVILKEQLLHNGRLLFVRDFGADVCAKMLRKLKTDGKGGVIDDNLPENDYNDSLDYSLTPRYKQLIKGG